VVRVESARRGAASRGRITRCRDAVRHHAGNRMALDNIRERLMLFYDLEAGLEIDEGGGRYRVRIRLPYRTSD